MWLSWVWNWEAANYFKLFNSWLVKIHFEIILLENITKESTVSGSGELKGEIRKIQAQLIELNSRIEN